MSWVVVGGTIVTGIGGAVANNQAKKAAQGAAGASKLAQVDPQVIAQIAREQAGVNLRDSLALEGQFAPANRDLRNESVQSLLAQLRGGTPYADLAMNSVAGSLQQPNSVAQRSQLLTDAIKTASDELKLGGQLSTDVRNNVTRRSISSAGNIGGGQLGLSRSIVPRDLGLTSMGLQQQRLGQAGTFGGFEQSLNQSDLENMLRQNITRSQLAQQLGGMENANTNQYLQLAQFGQSLQPPEAGLSPGDLASLYVQNASNSAVGAQNSAALAAQNARNNAQLYGQLAGQLGSIDYGSIYNRSPTVTQPYAQTSYLDGGGR